MYGLIRRADPTPDRPPKAVLEVLPPTEWLELVAAVRAQTHRSPSAAQCTALLYDGDPIAILVARLW